MPPPDQPAREQESKSEPDAIDRRREKPKPEIKVESRIVKRFPNKTPDKTTTKKEEEDSTAKARAEVAARRRTAQQLLARINGSSERLSENLSPGATIEPLGPGGEAYANYAQVVKTTNELTADHNLPFAWGALEESHLRSTIDRACAVQQGKPSAFAGCGDGFAVYVPGGVNYRFRQPYQTIYARD